jgi:RNA recognition motif-containing protein
VCFVLVPFLISQTHSREERRSAQAKSPTTTLFVVNFDQTSTRERDLQELFERFGRVVRVRIYFRLPCPSLLSLTAGCRWS